MSHVIHASPPPEGVERLPATDDGVLNELAAYAPVPPRRSVSVKVICRLSGRGQPLPYPIEDDA